MIKRWRGVPYFVANGFKYHRLNTNPTFALSPREIFYRSYDRYAPGGSVQLHYFQQDIWVARLVHDLGIKHLVDVGSRLDGYVAHLLVFCRVTFVDIRPLSVSVRNLKFIAGNITQLPFPAGSISCLSSLHVIEHIGLGRYGDPVDPDGHVKAAAELCRVLALGGTLILSTVVGRERLCFDGHRIFQPATIQAMFQDLTLESFSLIDDAEKHLADPEALERARKCNYGCGIFVFKKNQN